jgi:uncharacterized protein (TIGR03083 family)
MSDPDYLAHLARESARFSAALRAAPASARVPTCPDWEATDLWRHLARVQWFWGTIVEEGLTSGTEIDRLEAFDSDAVDDVPAWFDEVSARLHRVLAAADPAATAWTWADEQTVGFIRRRQAHEALIHRVDAELTAGERTALPADLRADGVDEVLRVMKSYTAPWATVTAAPGATLRLRGTDTGHTWLVSVGRFVGTDPEGTAYDEATIEVAEHADGRPTAAEISGVAADLDCWLWNRPPVGMVQREGAPEALEAFEEVRVDAVG